MKQYMSYKSCHIRWIGQIPSEWKVSKVKYLALENNSIFMDGDWINSEIIESEGIRYLTTGNVGAGEYKEQGDSFISEKSFSRLNCLTVLPGDVLISRLNEPIARACIVPDTYDKYVVAVDNVVLRPDIEWNKQYLVYCMNTSRYALSSPTLIRFWSRLFLTWMPTKNCVSKRATILKSISVSRLTTLLWMLSLDVWHRINSSAKEFWTMQNSVIQFEIF